MKLIEILVGLLKDDEPENVLTNVAGAIEEIIKSDPRNAKLIKQANGIPPLIALLKRENPVKTQLQNCVRIYKTISYES